MQWVERIAGRLGFERRNLASSPSWTALQALGTGNTYSERMSENFAAVAACTSAIATAIASVPALTYRRTGEARAEVFDNPVAELIRNGPNHHQTWPELMEAWVAQALLYGNGLLEIERDGVAIIGLKLIPWQWVSPLIGPSGRLVYDVTEQTGLYGQTGRVRRLLAGDVIHLRDRSDDGILGRSRLSRSADTLASAIQLNNFARNFIANGAQPSGAISTDHDLTPEMMALMRKQLEARHRGAGEAGRVMVLSGGVKFEQFQVSPEDAELLGSRKFAVEEICRLFQVPPPIVQDYSHNTFTNADTAGRWFAQFTLGPWARKIEAVLSRGLFPAGSGLELELDLSSFLRGDPQTRWAAHKVAVDGGILDPDEVREIEGFNPRTARPAIE